MRYTLEIYQTDTGKRPFSQWIKGLKNRATKAKIRLRLDRLEMGNLGHCRSIEKGIFELKIDFGPGYRIYFGKVGLQYILLLCAGDKSSQKKDIQKAKAYFMDYQARGGTNG